MRTYLATLSLLMISLSAAQAQDLCYADYKAKRDAPLRLHYGVIELAAPCGPESLPQDYADEIEQRISAKNWTLLNVLSVFDETGLEERRKSAGKFFLRF